VCCQDHWVTLTSYDRETIRASYRKAYGQTQYFRQVLAEVTAMHAHLRGISV
jgi:hypothetical protein